MAACGFVLRRGVVDRGVLTTKYEVIEGQEEIGSNSVSNGLTRVSFQSTNVLEAQVPAFVSRLVLKTVAIKSP